MEDMAGLEEIMTRRFLYVAAAAAAVATVWYGPVAAQSIKQLGSSASTEALIQALTPSGAPGAEEEGAFRTRGIRLQSASPANQSRPAGGAAPTIALDVKFELDSTALSPEAKELVKNLAAAVNSEQLKKYKFRLEGHTDSTGSAAYNLALSKRRAESVRNYMVQAFGVPSSRLEAVGYGLQRPLDPANPESGVNRRVQVMTLQ
jgi:outer membrane protein OmpA-like peptidoglycan-associated protein